MPLELKRRKGSANWYIRGTVRGIAVFESTGTPDRKAAEAIRIKREARLLEDSIYGKKATATFLEAAVSYAASGGSVRFLGNEHAGLTGEFAHRKLHTITQDDLDAVGRKLYPAAQPETINRQVHTPFIAVWNHAVGNGWAEPRQWRRPRRAKGTATLPRAKRSGTAPTDYATASRFVLAMWPAPALVMTALFYTGMRPIELFALETGDIDVAGRWIVVRSSKTGEPRGVPMHRMLAPMFDAMSKRGGRVFRTPRGAPYPLTEDGGGQISTAVNGARRRSGIMGVSPYTARHTVSTQLVVNGVHPHVKDQILGHAANDMSRHYTHVPQAPLIEAIDTLPVIDEWAAAPWLADPVGMTGKRLILNRGNYEADRRHG